MDEAIHHFLEYLKNERGRSENTLLAYKKDLDQFQAVWNQFDTHPESETIPIAIINRYLEWLLTQDYKNSTIVRKCVAVRGFIEFWRMDGILPLTYIDNQLKDLQSTRTSPKVLTQEQITDLMEAPKKLVTPLGLRDTAILSLMYQTGIRATDIINLMLDNIDLLAGYVIPASMPMNPIPLGEVTISLEAYLKNGRPHLARIPEEHSLFLNQRGQGLTRQGIWFIVRRWANEAQLGDGISPNTVRHSLIQHLMDSGLSNREIQHRLGLKSPNSLRAFNSSQRKAGDG